MLKKDVNWWDVALVVGIVVVAAISVYDIITNQQLHLNYVQDPRTGLCFARLRNTNSLAHVPCEAIPPRLLNKKD